MNLKIYHKTVYEYSVPVWFGPHKLFLRPRPCHNLQVKSFSVAVYPEHTLRWIRDVQENNVGLLDISKSAARLLIEMECHVEVIELNPFDFRLATSASKFPFEYDPETGLELLSSILPTYARDLVSIENWLRPIWQTGMRYDTVMLLQDINKAIYRDIQYQRRERRGVQTPAETLERKKGACRDFAALFMEICRFLGFAARFVSGYMYSEEITGQMSMHGWAEVYLPGAGWIGFDPSWGILTTSFYIPVAVSRHPEHVPPISGTYFGFGSDFLRTEVDLYVERSSGEIPRRQVARNLETD